MHTDLALFTVLAKINDEALRRIERELDLEDSRLKSET